MLSGGELFSLLNNQFQTINDENTENIYKIEKTKTIGSKLSKDPGMVSTARIKCQGCQLINLLGCFCKASNLG